MRAIMKVTPDEARDIVIDGGNEGVCIECGAEAYGVEPDAEGYQCESCGEQSVMGLENALFAGHIQIEEDGEVFEV